jgi:RNA polymerase sigma-B factor
VPTIVGELKRHFRDRSWAVRPPRSLQELSLRVDRTTRSLTQQLDRPPTVPEIARALDRDEEHVVEAQRARVGRAALGISQMQVSRILRKAIDRLSEIVHQQEQLQ